MKKTDAKKATPREDWLRAQGVVVGYAHVAGDPTKREQVEFCMFLRKIEPVRTSAMPGGQYEYSWKPFAYSMGCGLFPEFIKEADKSYRNDAARQEALAPLRQRYLRPNVEGFLACLISDVRSIAEGSDFDTFIDDFGFGDDAKRAHAAWVDVNDAWAKLLELLGGGAHAFARLQIEDDNA